jgi:hypothetical protein
MPGVGMLTAQPRLTELPAPQLATRLSFFEDLYRFFMSYYICDS